MLGLLGVPITKHDLGSRDIGLYIPNRTRSINDAASLERHVSLPSHNPRRCFNISLRGASEVLCCLSEEDGNDLDEHDDADDDDEDDCMGWR